LPSACFLVALVIRAIFERVVVDVEKQKLKLSKLLEVAAKEQAKLLLAEKQQKAREAVRSHGRKPRSVPSCSARPMHTEKSCWAG